MRVAAAAPSQHRLRWLVIGIPMLWLGALFLVPFALIAKVSLSTALTAQPPYRPVFDLGAGWQRFIEDVSALGFDTYAVLFQDSIYISALLNAFLLAGLATVILLTIAYPLAFALVRLPPRWKWLALGLVILPFWTSFLIRAYAWIGILRQDGYLNSLLLWSGAISQPLTLLNTDAAVVLGFVYAYLPFMALPVYAAVERIDRRLIEAAQDLGSTPAQTFWRVTLPLTLPGAMAGALLVFIPAAGEVIIPDLLGGSDTLMIGRVLWSEFFSNRDWPLASAIAVMLLVALLPPIILYRRLEASTWGRAAAHSGGKGAVR